MNHGNTIRTKLKQDCQCTACQIGNDLKNTITSTYLNWESATKQTVNGGNIAMARFEIAGNSGAYGAHTRINDSRGWLKVPSDPTFPALKVNVFREMGGGSHKLGSDRLHDTESRILHRLHNQIVKRGLQGQEGRIDLYTKLEPCLSCDNIIIQFLREHTNLTVHIYYETDYPQRPKKHQ